MTPKRMRAAAFIALVTLAGIAITLQAQDQSKKGTTPSTAKTEQASKMKSKDAGKMKCCMGDSTSCAKDGKSCCGDMKKR